MDKKIGKGSYGNVFLATDKNNKSVAIKIFSNSRKSNRTEVNIYKILTKVKNYTNYLPKIYYIFENYVFYYMIMEYYPKGHLCKDLIVKYPSVFTLDKIVDTIKQIVDIIEFIHNKKLIINDLKPDNIMINNNFEPRIIDLGLFSHEDIYNNICGTPYYLPPESFDNIFSYYKKDIWSLGLTIYNFLFDINPFKRIISRNYNKKIIINKNEIDNVIKEIEESFSHLDIVMNNNYEKIIHIKEFVLNCLNKDFEKRPDIFILKSNIISN